LRKRRPSIYSEAVQTIRILHEEEEGAWGFTSPDIPGLVGGGDSYAEARQMAEEAVRFFLETDDVIVEHYVPEAARLVAAR
jgi:predicted RNase H-like HicB family nuclease